MAQKELTPDEIMQQLAGMGKLMEQAQTPALEELAAMQEKRARRLQQVEARLAPELGRDHPRVAALRRARRRAAALHSDLSGSAAQASKLPELKPYEWMVYGHVQDQAGQPVSDAVVRVFDKDRKYDDMLGYTQTDEGGDFHLVYHERAFYEPGEEAPELYLRVEDQQGNELYASEDNIEYKSGRIEYFLIEIRAERAEK
jgi:hypothetical protein